MPSKAKDDDVVMSLVELALACPQEERLSYLRTACGGDSELFEEVWKYIQQEQQMNGFLLDPLFPSPAEERVLQAGEILEGRFRILRQVGEGGMGVVYEALDEKLDRRIAIKFAKLGFRKRLPPEVRHASEIAHPNVCKIFEIHTAMIEGAEIDFITMEFLEGETLAERLRQFHKAPQISAGSTETMPQAAPSYRPSFRRLSKVARLPKQEMTAIARQICAGLAEAHRNGVVHGDLKSGNVILVKAGSHTRAVITDFGLACRPGTAAQAGQSGSLRGTPDYMAPELWRGEKTSPASDVYALGVILNELIAGRRPFGPEVLLEDRLTRKPPAAHTKWDKVLARCLDPEPAKRFRDAGEVAAAITPRSRRWMLAAGVGVVLAVITGVMTWENATAPKETIRLAVLPFETDAANRALADGLLHQTAEQLRHLKHTREFRFTVFSLADALQNRVSRPENAGEMLGATHALTGSIRWDRGQVSVRVFLVDVRSRLAIRDWGGEYPQEAIHQLPFALAGFVTGTLRLPALPAVMAVNPAAYTDFTKGTGLLERRMVDSALPFLQNAVSADSESPLTHVRLAEAQLLKYENTDEAIWLDRAIASFGSARQRNPDLPGVWLVSARINRHLGAYETAVENVRRALDIDPQNAEAWRYLGQIYKDSHRFSEALAAYQKGLEVQPALYTNYEYICYLYSDLGRYEEGIHYCLRLVALAANSPDAHLTLANAYGNWGHYTESENESRTALSLDPSSAKASHLLAVALAYEGRYQEAIFYFRDALKKGSASHLLYLNFGITLQWAGLASEAQQSYRKALELAKALLAKNSRNSDVRARLAYLYAQMGERDRAMDEAAIVGQVAEGSTNAVYWLVRTYEALGERGRAIASAEHAPDETLHRLTRQRDLVDFLSDRRFQELLRSHHIG